MKRYLVSLSSLLLLGGLSFSEEKKEFQVVSSIPITISGGITGGYFWTNNTGTSSDEDDKLQLSNAILELSGEYGKDIKFGFDIALGSVLVPTIWDGGQGDPVRYSFTDSAVGTEGAGIIWGYATFKPYKGISIDAGVIPTNVGYEVANTYANPNITLGFVWNAQPVIYEGARVSFDLNELVNIPLGFYAEYNQEGNSDNFAAGINGEFAGVSFALSYYDYRASKNLVDLVLGYSIANVDLGLNFDYQWLDDSAKSPNQDDSAYGVALYFIPKFETGKGEVSIPVRLEYFDEGTSGIYSGAYADTGYSVTVTPTYRPIPNGFIRAEVAYVSTDKKIFKNNTEDNKTTLAVEIGFTF
ncbi:outer membrane beta-barrel protein [Aquifex sp.]